MSAGPPERAWPLPVRVARLALFFGWSAALVFASIPREIRPASLDAPYKAAYAFFRSFGTMAGQRVFPGYPGDRHRHLWAARFVGVWPDGAERTLEEWPEGLAVPRWRVGEDLSDVAWYRLDGMENLVYMLRNVGTTYEDKYLRQFRKGAGPARLMRRFFCSSARFEVEGQGPRSVRLDAFYANKAYSSGKIEMRRNTVHSVACHGLGGPIPDTPPPDPPAWWVDPEAP